MDEERRRRRREGELTHILSTECTYRGGFVAVSSIWTSHASLHSNRAVEGIPPCGTSLTARLSLKPKKNRQKERKEKKKKAGSPGKIDGYVKTSKRSQQQGRNLAIEIYFPHKRR